MILTEKDISEVLEPFCSKESVRGYSIRIDGKTFKTSSGKIVWKEKSHAKAAFKNAVNFLVNRKVYQKLAHQGLSIDDIYRNPEYKNAWNNFKRYLDDNNIIQIVEMEY